MLFTDWVCAFHSALPELALVTIPSSRRQAQVFDAVGIGCDSHRARLEEWIRSDHHSVAAGCGRRRMAADFLVGPEEGSSSLCWKSIAFQKSLEHSLMQAGASVRVSRRCAGIFGTLTRTRSLATVPEGAVRIASDIGVRLILAPGKTEAVVSWVGSGFRPVRRRLMLLSPNRQVK